MLGIKILATVLTIISIGCCAHAGYDAYKEKKTRWVWTFALLAVWVLHPWFLIITGRSI
ncbi:MAG: hypothetical protein ACRCX7_11470 [Cetobacterium sp.]|uniref:hypothetical protein n=1 Tax=Cetobacterium sp. TaxID=2071632 RepID=UPI003F2B3FC5